MLDKKVYDNLIKELKTNIKFIITEDEFTGSLSEDNFLPANCGRIFFFGNKLTKERFAKITEVYHKFSMILHEIINQIAQNSMYNFSSNEEFKIRKDEFIKDIYEIIIKPKIDYFNSNLAEITSQTRKQNIERIINKITNLKIEDLNIDEIKRDLNSILLAFRDLVINYALDARNKVKFLPAGLTNIQNSLTCTVNLLVASLIAGREFNPQISQETAGSEVVEVTAEIIEAAGSGAAMVTSEAISKSNEASASVDIAESSRCLEEENQEKRSLVAGCTGYRDHVDQQATSLHNVWNKCMTWQPDNHSIDLEVPEAAIEGVGSERSFAVRRTLSICSGSAYTDITESTTQILAEDQVYEIEGRLSNAEKITTKLTEDTAKLLIEMTKSSNIEEQKKGLDLIEGIAKNSGERCTNSRGFLVLANNINGFYNLHKNNASNTSNNKAKVPSKLKLTIN